jgi:hypothetical protein
MIYIGAAANRVYDVASARELIMQLQACIDAIASPEQPTADPVSPTGADPDRSGADAYRHGDPIVPLTKRKRG